jgi:rhodanese-related sulfurtransferase
MAEGETERKTAMTLAMEPMAAGATGDVTPRLASEWIRDGQAVLIDVREADEHARERIVGAKLVPLSRFDVAEVERSADRVRRVVIHCRSGKRGADACRMAAGLAAKGIAVHNLAGGIEAWKREGLPTVVDTGVSGISVMRQVQLVIGVLALTGSALAWFVHPGFVALPAFLGAGLTFAGATGTCALATVIGMMPWNKSAGASCAAR